MQETNIQSEMHVNNNVEKKKNPLFKFLAIIGGIFVVVIFLVIVVILIVSSTSEKLVCKSSEGNITIMYTKKGITGYTAKGLIYDFDGQKEIAKKIGIEEYIIEFNDWFTTNTSGECTIDGKKVEDKTNEDNNTSNETDVDTKIVGNDEYGYIEIPSNWVNFYDIDGNNSLQYSYANVYIVSLNYLDKKGYTAKDYASNYFQNKENDSSVEGVTGATVKIGKNKEYTAYQVYMYYPSESIYLVTYWFEAEDDKVHYIALEGPSSVIDYISIPESFSLTK